MTKNIPLLYGFSFFDQFMIVIALWVPYLATQGIGMRQFMELQAVFAIVILSGEVPSGLLSDLWGRKKTLLLGSTLQGRQFFPPPAVEQLRGRPQHDFGRRRGAPLRLVSRGGWREVPRSGPPRQREAGGANGDGGERAPGGARSSPYPMGICCGPTRS